MPIHPLYSTGYFIKDIVIACGIIAPVFGISYTVVLICSKIFKI